MIVHNSCRGLKYQKFDNIMLQIETCIFQI